jgi:replicative DNA helicase
MNVEQRLICKIIKSGDYRSVQQAGIRPSMFRSAEGRQMFNAIKTYFNNKRHYGKTPKRDWMKDRFPAFEYVKVREDVDELCEILRTRAIERQIEGALEDVSQTLDGEGPYEAIALYRSKLLQIQTMVPSSRDIILAESADELIEEYKKVKESDGVLGVPWPWDELNIQTQGMLPGEFIVLYGRLKSMKTWIALLIAVHAYVTGNRRVLFCSCEMPPEQVRRRVAAILCGLDYDLLKKAKLPKKVRVAYFRRLKRLKAEEKQNATKTHERSFLITSDKENPAGAV